MSDDEAAARSREPGERRNRIRWAYACGAIALLCDMLGLGRSIVPLGFGIFGCILVGQLFQAGEQRHASFAGALALGGLLIWLTHNLPLIRHYAGV